MSARDNIKFRAMQWARESAEQSLKFIGEKPFEGLPAFKVVQIKAALVSFCEQGAKEAVEGLERHGNKLTI